ncbi:MAG: hypothetical protein DRJ40_02030 [Thermoprotei archaeon]|nr:MAG: hypothetical protein DRJ40_02030 [Thermoprotei archaeon]
MLHILPQVDKVNELRKPTVRDLGKRLSVLSPENITLENYPKKVPVAAFNTTFLARNKTLHLYTRVVLGYFRYVSAIAHLELKLDDVYCGDLIGKKYSAQLVLAPDLEIDLWGCEDPRIQNLGEYLAITYVGRSAARLYVSDVVEGTVPVVALSKDGYCWRKVSYLTLPKSLRHHLTGVRDTVVLDTGSEEIFILHVPHFLNFPQCLWVGEVHRDDLLENLKRSDVSEVMIRNNYVLMIPATFEEALGWDTAPIKISDDEYLILAHAVNVDQVYRVFALLLRYEGGKLTISGITPHYIMEPRTPYEKYGDRPYVVFPCGAQRYGDRLLITYGASDSFIGFAEIEIDELLSEVKEIT